MVTQIREALNPVLRNYHIHFVLSTLVVFFFLTVFYAVDQQRPRNIVGDDAFEPGTIALEMQYDIVL